MAKVTSLVWDEPQQVTYAIPLWLRDQQVLASIKRTPNRVQPATEPRTEPIALVCYGPSLNDTWEEIRKFQWIMSCSGAHRFLIDRGIVPTWDLTVDPRAHKVDLIGPPHKDVQYLVSSTCHAKVWDHLEGFNVALWHVFSTEEEAKRILPRGEHALMGGSSAGLRTMTLARFFGFHDFHIFGMDGCEGPTGKHAGPHPNQPSLAYDCEYPSGSGKIFRTTPSMLMCARETFSELDKLGDVRATFYGDGLVQAMAKDHVPNPVPHAAFCAVSPPLITPEYAAANAQMHADNLAYGVGGGRHAQAVERIVTGLVRDLNKTQVSVLDYGCGKGYLQKALSFPIWEYDPAVPGKQEQPRPADLVVCTDVLEHIEPDNLNHVLNHLKHCVRVVGYFVIHMGPSSKTLPDGRNSHLIQKDAKWWLSKLHKRFNIPKHGVRIVGPLLFVVVGRKTGAKAAG